MAGMRRVMNLFRRGRVNREIEAELRAHIEMRTEENIAAGMTLAAARRDALVRFGNVTAMGERVAERDVNLDLEGVWRDVRYAGRQLRRSPGFAATAIVILALGIGASAAIFSAVNPILLEPLPYPHAGRIVTIWDAYQGQRIETTFGTFRELKARSRSLEELATFEPWQPVLTGEQTPERLDGQSVSTEFFNVLGVAPAVGRDFEAEDNVPHGPNVVVLSDGFWRRHFGANTVAIGRNIRLDDDLYTVVGVMPRGFEDVLDPGAEVWTAMQYDPATLGDFTTSAWGHHFRLAGRMRAGASVDETRRELEQIARNPQREFPRPRWAALPAGLIVDGLQQDMVRGVRPALLAVMGAVGLLLMIACVNVTNLLLARGAMRQGEFAMRAALGAAKARLMRQSITESLLLTLMGGALGLAVAAAGVGILVALSPPGLPRADAIALNGPAFAFALAVSALVGVAAGLMPALETQRAHLQAGLRQATRTTSRAGQKMRSVLVVAEVALALMLLVTAGLLLRSMQRLLSVDPGFRSANVLTMQVQTAGHKFDDLDSNPGAGNAMRRRFYDDALEEARKVPGVTAAGYTSLLPLSGDPYWVAVYGSHFEQDPPDGGGNVYRYAVSPGYCQAMQIPLLRGRYIDDGDTAKSPFVALISASLARREFGKGDPLGKRLHAGPTNYPWFTVVGVVGDVRQSSLALTDADEVYLPESQSWFADNAVSFAVRTRGDAAAMAGAVRAAIWRADKDQPVVRVATMSRLLDLSVAERRFVLILFEAFALVALALAGTGIYGILANSVAERTREMGVRAALGAGRRDLVALVLRRGLALTAVGVVLGLGGAAVASRAVASLLYGTSPLDPATYGAVAALLVAIAVLACVAPARRAANVDPMEALRSE
ncbi:MAG TPA: ABC transporter permease [Terracidiphilus sp.]|jgi:putative ABC transport system permease protein|nr:ABC transporter permease [Terracidiphilus sp.]